MIRCNLWVSRASKRDVSARGEVRLRCWPVAAAICAACLAVLATACGGTATSTASPPATPGLTATAPATTGPAGAADTHIKVYGNCTTPSFEPGQIVMACADYGALMEGLRWTSWTAANATAVGTLVYNDCTPDCAAGHHHRVPGTRITLTVPVHGAGGQVVWSQIQENPEPPGYPTGPYHGGPQPLPVRPI
jgi:hypothetical protein